MYSPPIVERWYKDTETLHHFEVVDFDKGRALIEIQYDNGDIGEFTLEDWKLLDLFPAHPPTDHLVSFEIYSLGEYQEFGEYEYDFNIEKGEYDELNEAFESLSGSIDDRMLIKSEFHQDAHVYHV